MHTTLSAAAALLSAVQYASAQTFTSCNPLTASMPPSPCYYLQWLTPPACPNDPALGTTLITDFTQGASDFWTPAIGTTVTYDGNGANFDIKVATDAPTMSATKYIFFGKVTVEAKAATGTGIVSSFILQSDDLDEIDWEWLGGVDDSVETNFFGKDNTTSYDRATYPGVADPVNTFHTYTIDWTSAAITWSIDNVAVRTLTYDDPLTVNGQNYPQTPMYVKLGNWVGCASAAAAADPKTAGTCSWAGGPANFAAGPFSMQVKSVTIQDYGCASEYSYSDHTGSYESIKSIGGCKGGTTTSSGTGTGTGSSTGSTGSSGSSTSTTTAKSTTTKPSTTAKPTTSVSQNATSSSVAASTTVASTGATSPTTSQSSSPIPTHNAASSMQSGLGGLNYAVGALGLALGYLVM